MIDKTFINEHLKILEDCVKNASDEIIEIYKSDELGH